jgi:hypothetical protein
MEQIEIVMSRTAKTRTRKGKTPRRPLPWMRIVAAGVYIVLLAAVFMYEYRAYAMLGDARQHEAADNAALAATTGERLAMQYPFSTAIPAARDMVVRLDRSLPDSGHGIWDGLHPLRVDWLPLWGLPACAVAAALVCLTRLGRRNRWAVAALALATLATAATLLVWGWFGYPAGGWLTPLLIYAAPALDNPLCTYGLTWALIVIVAAIMLCPMQSPQAAKVALGKARPDSPNDPRMALQLLKAQRAEHHLGTLDYVRRREAILSRI